MTGIVLTTNRAPGTICKVARHAAQEGERTVRHFGDQHRVPTGNQGALRGKTSPVLAQCPRNHRGENAQKDAHDYEYRGDDGPGLRVKQQGEQGHQKSPGQTLRRSRECNPGRGHSPQDLFGHVQI